MVKHFGNGLQPLGEFSISRAHDVLRYLIKAEARGDKDGRARFRLTNKNLLSTIAMLYRAVRECRALRKRGVVYSTWMRLLELMLTSCKYKLDGVGKACAYARADGSLYPSNSPSSV